MGKTFENLFLFLFYGQKQEFGLYIKLWTCAYDHKLAFCSKSEFITRYIMAIRVVEFSNGVYKIRKIFAKKSTYPKKVIEF